MIPRTIQRTLRHPSPLKPPQQWHTCTCRCGAPIQPPQQRQYARKAPSTIGRKIARESQILTPEQQRRERLRLQHNSGWFTRQCHALSRLQHILCSGDAALAFLEAFGKAMAASRGQNAVDSKIFIRLLNEHGLCPGDAEVLSRVLLRDDEERNRYRGKKLLYSLSKAGYVESTIRIMAHACLEAKTRPTVLGSREIKDSREHLTKVANEPNSPHFRAMVLEGKIALKLGKEDYAIRMFNNAMAAAVAVSERILADPKTKDRPWLQDPLELGAPWHELMQVHLYRSQHRGLDEMALCEAAMEIGCAQDDPVSHKFYADYVKRWDHSPDHSEPIHIGTSDWLYHITKAASSGVPQAAYELGVFYAESGWKYIEDEPPDHVKPTAFDSYPAPIRSKALGTFWDTLHLVGLKTRNFTPQERSFHNALFPHTAVGRLKIAIGWLEEAAGYHYAPAYLMLARLYARKTLWAQADAPKDALELRDGRYSYASKEDFEAGRAIQKSWVVNAVNAIRDYSELEDPPNPLYDSEKAKEYLREVFDAYEAFEFGERVRRNYERGRKIGTVDKVLDDENEVLSVDYLVSRGLEERLRKWFKFPEVREMNDERIRGLWEEAKGVCEEEEWEVLGEDGGLVYRPGVGGER